MGHESSGIGYGTEDEQKMWEIGDRAWVFRNTTLDYSIGIWDCRNITWRRDIDIRHSRNRVWDFRNRTWHCSNRTWHFNTGLVVLGVWWNLVVVFTGSGGIEHETSEIGHDGSVIGHVASEIEHEALGIRHENSEIRYEASGIGHEARGTRYET